MGIVRPSTSTFARAISVAVIGDKAKTVFQAFPDEPTAMQALRAGKVQVIATATPSLINQVAFGAIFSPAVLFDGEGFLVKKTSGHLQPGRPGREESLFHRPDQQR